MRIRTRIALALAWLALAAPAAAQIDPEAQAALRKAVDTLTFARSLSVKVDYESKGTFTGNPRLSYTAKVLRFDDQPARTHFLMDGRAEPILGFTEHPLDILVVERGSITGWVDPVEKKIVERPSRQARSDVVTIAGLARPLELIEPAKLVELLECPNVLMDEVIQLDGQVCDVIYVDLGDQQQKTRMAIARTDGVPRRIERILPGVVTYTFTVTQVQVDPPLTEDDFKIADREGYSWDSPYRPAPGQGHEPPQLRRTGTKVGEVAPLFELHDSTGKLVRTSDLRGHVVVLYFWGTWSTTCRQTSPLVHKLAEDYKDKGVKVFGLTVRERDDNAPIEVVKNEKFAFVLLPKAEEVAKTFEVLRYPAYVVLAKGGEVLYRDALYREGETFEKMRAAIDQYLKTGVVPGGEGPAPVTPAGAAARDPAAGG